MTDERVLIIRLAGIGDVVMASALAARVRAEEPSTRITWMTGSVSAPLAEAFDCVDDVVAVDERKLLRGGVAERGGELARIWRALIGRGFKRVFLLHPDARYRALVAPMISAPVIRPRRDEFGAMNPIPGRYFGDEYARMYDGPAHVGPIVGHFPLARLRGEAPSVNPKRVAIVPGGAKNVLRESALRRWPVESYAALARELRNDGREVVLIGNTDDEWVRPHFAGVDVIDEIGRRSLVETARLIAECGALVSHDTGPMHLGALVRTPLVAIFGPTNPSQFLVESDSAVALWGGAHLACRPCYDGKELAACSDNQCVKSVSVGAVISALDRVAPKNAPTRLQPAPASRAESAPH